MRKRKKKSFEIWQGHHITYEPELIVLITRTEHFFAGRLQPYFKARGISKGMKDLFKWCGKNYPTNPVPNDVKRRKRQSMKLGAKPSIGSEKTAVSSNLTSV